MPSPSEVIRLRQQRAEKAQRNPGGWIGMGCSLLLIILMILGLTGFALLYTNLTADLPSVDALPTLLDPIHGQLLQPTSIYDKSGDHLLLALENPAAGQRQFLTLDPSQSNFLPASLITATLAASDPTFWSHPGATLEGLTQDSQATLAQRLVSDLLLWNEPPGIRRALRERLVAAQVTSQFGRAQVLAWYLNSADYGRLAFGADAASQVYFGKPAAKLSLVEAAILAATAEAPSLNPLDAPQVAMQRGQELIQKMLARGMITSPQAQAAQQAKITLQTPESSDSRVAPAFVDLVLEQLSQEVDLNRLERGGYRVITTLDYDLQLQATCAAEAQISRLENLSEPGVTLDGNDCEASRLLPTLPTQSKEINQGLGASAVILEPSTGRVLAMVGDAAQGTDPAHLPGHSAGSLLTPFIYLTGFTQGMGPASLLWDIPSSTSEIQNQGLFHGPVRLRTALANDYLEPASQVLSQVGIGNVLHIMGDLGLPTSEIARDDRVSKFLENSKITLLDISQAFSAFANQGTLAGWTPNLPRSMNGENLEVATLLRLEDTDGKILEENRLPQTKPVISPQLSYLLTNALSDEPARWPSLGHPNALEIGRPVAAKLGSTQAGKDAWAIGYTPNLVVGTWLGQKSNSSSGRVNPEMAAGLWHAIIQYSSRNLPAQSWSVPQGVSTVPVCDPSGLLPGPDCPTVVNEIFLSGNEPIQVDNLYKKLQINRETGRLATVFTPPELVEDHTYMIVPPEAAAWARQAGLATPPETYDVILASQTTSPEVSITSPAMFAYVKDKVTIEGSAGGDGFEFYRLQVGEGLNPQEWIQIGEENTVPVTKGALGIWDTQGLSGLYAIQLLVVHKNQQIDTAIVQVTVDNQPPSVKILYPSSGQVVEAQDTYLVLRSDANDDLALSKVDFYIDGKQVDSVVQAPYSIAWKPTNGKHTLLVKASDQAGNISQTSVGFTVTGGQ